MSCDNCKGIVEISIDYQGDSDNVYHYCRGCFLNKFGKYCLECNRLEYDGKRINLLRWIYGSPDPSNCSDLEH